MKCNITTTFRMCPWCGQTSVEPTAKKIKAAIENEMLQIRKIQNMSEGKETVNYEALLFQHDIHTANIYRLEHPTCSHCGEEYEVRVMSDDELIEKGHKLYEEYKEFLAEGGENLPRDIVVIVNPEMRGGLCRYDNRLKKLVVEVDPKNMNLNRCEIVPLFFHEFTHVHDIYDPKTGGERNNEAIFYSEYRASAIQMLKMLNYNSIDSNKKISLSSRVITDNKTFNVKDYFEYQTARELDRNENQYKTLNQSNFLSFIQNFVYFLGEVSVFKRKLDKESMKQILTNADKYETLMEKKLQFENDVKFHELFQSLVYFDDYFIEEELNSITFNLSNENNLKEYLERGEHLKQLLSNLWSYLPEATHR